MTDESKIREMVAAFEHKSSYGTEPYYDQIKELGASVIPYFIEAYPNASRWQQRASYVYRSIPYARTSKHAISLAIAALEDRSKVVRYRACMLLACSLDASAMDSLEKSANHSNPETRADVKAAIDAISSKNHNYFVDRKHSGKIFLKYDRTNRKR